MNPVRDPPRPRRRPLDIEMSTGKTADNLDAVALHGAAGSLPWTIESGRNAETIHGKRGGRWEWGVRHMVR